MKKTEKFIKFVKDNQEEIMELNPLDNSITTKDGTKIEWQVDPNIEFSEDVLERLDETKVSLKSTFDIEGSDTFFKENEIEFSIGVDGKVKSFYSPIGSDGFVATATVKINY